MKRERPDFTIKPPFFSALRGDNARGGVGLVLLICLTGFLAAMGVFSGTVIAQSPSLYKTPDDLSVLNLLASTFCTAARMGAVLCCAIVVALASAVAATKNQYARLLLEPILEVCQSVPVLGLFFFSLLAFQASIVPHGLSLEMATVMTATVCVAWRLAGAVYRALRCLPADLDEAALSLRLTSWQRLWSLELPYVLPALVSSLRISSAATWLVITFCEGARIAPSHGMLTGLGAFASAAALQGNIWKAVCAVLAMGLVLLAYDHILFRPATAWAQRFESVPMPENISDPFFLRWYRRSSIINLLTSSLRKVLRQLGRLPIGAKPSSVSGSKSRWESNAQRGLVKGIFFWSVCVVGAALALLFCLQTYSVAQYQDVLLRGLATTARTLIILIVSSLIWVPIGVYVGQRRSIAYKVARFAYYAMAFPANLLFPFFALATVSRHEPSEIWVIVGLLISVQGFILVSVIDGMKYFPPALLEVGRNFHVRGFLLWRKVLAPGILPYYVVGLSTASATIWNVTIVAESMEWEGQTAPVYGIGAYIAQAMRTGSIHQVALGCVCMTIMAMMSNLLIWHPTMRYVQRTLKISDKAL
ncbi:ABC transporter permease subunit [Acetobacter cibinongensis]|uniref:ABC transmembrane type-1 domain-containing protein n=1 Tax=Acetobacter cibinongensis TaxID=146475 RepID=A0A1Z5YYG4_9PROT|nr:ABC transporter permease subunit [Acetobacter cibinongensis]OUJ04355.1 hypothetical protein HK14_10645 [Acetobacter cibinongensis]